MSSLKLVKNEKTAKNVIIFVGDGMGPNTITASRIYRGGETSTLDFETFPNVALIKVSRRKSQVVVVVVAVVKIHAR